MSVKQRYGEAIWTNHALDRLHQRGLSQEWAWRAFQYPDKSITGKTSGSYEFIKNIDQYKITVIGKKNDHGEWVILSCWVDPPMPGSIDIKPYRVRGKYHYRGFWGEIKQIFKDMFGF